MPCNYQLDEDRQLVITTAWDTLTGAEVLEHQHKLKSDPGFNRDFSQLLDLSRVTQIQMDLMTVLDLADIDLYSSKSRRAFLAPNPLAYGMSRMFIAFREMSVRAAQMRVFSDRDEALQWLYEI